VVPFARNAESVSSSFIDVNPPFSFFSFAENFFPSNTLSRILSQVRQHCAQTMVVEKLEADSAGDLKEENEDILVRYPGLSESRVYRLSFFSKKCSSRSDLSNVSAEDFIGYAILKCDQVSGKQPTRRIYESVIRPSRRVNNFIHGSQQWLCTVQGLDLPVQGYMYAQQNGITNVCAHAALRTVAARFHGNGDMTYREMNTLTGIPSEGIPKFDHVQRKAGEGEYDGLFPDEMVTILKNAGCNPLLYKYDKYPSSGKNFPPFEKYVYGSIESGFPVIVGFETGSNHHAIPLFGHTFNEDTWAPSADFIYFIGNTRFTPSDSWLSAFIGHDDNLGSNFCVPRTFLRTRRPCDLSGCLCPFEQRPVAYVIATVPADVRVDAVEAEALGVLCLPPLLDELKGQEVWTNRLKRYSQRGLLVFRSMLMNVGSYVNHLMKIRDWSSGQLDETQLASLKALDAHRNVWMIELSVPELFSANRRKIAELVIGADKAVDPLNPFDNLLIARLPGYFALPLSLGNNQPKFKFIRSNVTGHVQLYGCE